VAVRTTIGHLGRTSATRFFIVIQTPRFFVIQTGKRSCSLPVNVNDCESFCLANQIVPRRLLICISFARFTQIAPSSPTVFASEVCLNLHINKELPLFLAQVFGMFRYKIGINLALFGIAGKSPNFYAEFIIFRRLIKPRV
jgi:hypothetical protein